MPGYYPNYNSTINATSSPSSPHTLNTSVPCLPCPQNCLFCSNATFCLACNTLTYLTFSGSCLYICSSDQSFNNNSNTCTLSTSSTYDQVGQLGYSWTYTANNSLLNIILTFSQPDAQYYYY